MSQELGWMIGGFAIGLTAVALYFGGLWLTVRKIGAARWPGQRLLVSFVLRLGLLLVVFYWLTGQCWTALAAALLGLLVARQLWLAAKSRVHPVARG